MKCTSCQARFSIDKPPKLGDYYCPSCGFSNTVVDKGALAVLKAALATPKVQQTLVVQPITQVLKQPKTKDTNG